ncbi:hypothetical protein D3C73_893500 [compost metagenome]
MFEINFKIGDSAETLAQLIDEAIATDESGEYGIDSVLKQYPTEIIEVTWNDTVVGRLVVKHESDSVTVDQFTPAN